MDIPILYEDDNYIVFNKPAGLVVHPDGRSKEATLVDWLLEHRPDMKNVGEPLIIAGKEEEVDEDGAEKIAAKPGQTILRPGIVHRLDKDTSGALVVAKNQKAFEDLKNKFKNREVDKKYHTFVYGDLKEEDATINRPIGRSRTDFRLWSAQRGARGEMRDAITNYRVMARGNDSTNGEAVNLVEVEPKTGRTHQIRVHFKAIHHPVVADPLYAPKMAPLLGFERLALHSVSISFKGIDGKKISVRAPYPGDFMRAVEMLQKD